MFKIGDVVTCRSILAKSRLMGRPVDLEIANYPSLVGVPLTIVDIQSPWIICTRASGTFAPGLLEEDLELFNLPILLTNER